MMKFFNLRLVFTAAFASFWFFESAPAQEPSQYPEPNLPTLLIPEAPVASEADVEVDAFLQVPAARAEYNVTGRGLAVVVIDTGINLDHISFQGRLISGRNFSEDGGAGEMRDTTKNRHGAIIPSGHGSNVAGIIAGNRLPSFENIPSGIAYESKIVPLKVFPGGQFSRINESLQWVLDNRERILADDGVLISVVNMSLGVPGDNRRNDSGVNSDLAAQRSLIKRLRDMNVAVVVSAGNSYASFNPSVEGMAAPGIFRETVSVAAVYDSNLPANTPPLPITYSDGGTVRQAVAGRLTVFSQRLGEIAGGAFRTDICAPGFFVTSAGPAVGNDPTRSRTTQDGTSQAAPTISGLILLAQQHWRNRKQAADPSSFAERDLPTVDLLEVALRDGGTAFQDVEEPTDHQFDNVTGCGATFHRANALGLLARIDFETPSESQPAVPSNVLSLKALQAEMFGKSLEDQEKILNQFRSSSGKFDVFKKK